jgi:hypothetical protein
VQALPSLRRRSGGRIEIRWAIRTASGAVLRRVTPPVDSRHTEVESLNPLSWQKLPAQVSWTSHTPGSPHAVPSGPLILDGPDIGAVEGVRDRRVIDGTRRPALI